MQSRVPAQNTTDATIEQFALHNCQCGIRTKRGARAAGAGIADRRRGGRRFVDFLRERGVINRVAPLDTSDVDPRMAGFVQLLNRERGATAETIRRYRQEASRWISSLGPNPKHFDAKAIREATPDKGGHKANAIGLIQQAMGEVQAGIDFAAQHFGD